MPTLVFVVGGVLVALALWAQRRLIRPRAVDTALSPETLRAVFARTVTGVGWRIVDEEGEPLVAESWWLTGWQRIGLSTARHGDRTRARVEVLSYSGQLFGMPRRPYTLGWRIDSFLGAVAERDPTAEVSG